MYPSQNLNEVLREMVQAEKKTRFTAGPLTFIARHELWDGNIQDHADQGVAITVVTDVKGKQTILLRFNCFDIEKSYIYGPENPDFKAVGPQKDRLLALSRDFRLSGNPRRS